MFMKQQKEKLVEILKNLSEIKLKKLNELLEAKAKKSSKKDTTKKEKDLYDISPEEGKLTDILGKHISKMSTKDAISKLVSWANKNKKKQKSARGMITYIMNITDRSETKNIKKYKNILDGINKEFEKINNKK